MKFMATWKVPPSTQRAAAERFLTGGAPMPEGLTQLGRWHVPGSASGFLLVEAEDLGPLATHLAEWGDMMDIEVTPVMEDEAAGAAIAQGVG